MSAIKLVFGPLVMVKVPRFPISCVMAVVALRSKLELVFIILLMTGVAI